MRYKNILNVYFVISIMLISCYISVNRSNDINVIESSNKYIDSQGNVMYKSAKRVKPLIDVIDKKDLDNVTVNKVNFRIDDSLVRSKDNFMNIDINYPQFEHLNNNDNEKAINYYLKSIAFVSFDQKSYKDSLVWLESILFEKEYFLSFFLDYEIIFLNTETMSIM